MINDAGLKLIKEFEGCALTAYQDSRGWAIGYGHTDDVLPGQTCTAEEALTLLLEDIPKYEKMVRSLVEVSLSSNQFAALVSFVYNEGVTSLGRSTLLHFLNMGHYEDAAGEFLKWTKRNGEFSEGLLRRRKAEKALFES